MRPGAPSASRSRRAAVASSCVPPRLATSNRRGSPQRATDNCHPEPASGAVAPLAHCSYTSDAISSRRSSRVSCGSHACSSAPSARGTAARSRRRQPRSLRRRGRRRAARRGECRFTETGDAVEASARAAFGLGERGVLPTALEQAGGLHPAERGYSVPCAVSRRAASRSWIADASANPWNSGSPPRWASSPAARIETSIGSSTPAFRRGMAKHKQNLRIVNVFPRQT